MGPTATFLSKLIWFLLLLLQNVSEKLYDILEQISTISVLSDWLRLDLEKLPLYLKYCF